MSTEYTYRATICVPVGLIPAANHLACIVGETATDIHTFTEATHTRGGKEYSCITTVVKESFVGYLEQGLPEPEHAAGADRAEAEQAFAGINTPEGIQLYITEAKGSSGIQELLKHGYEPVLPEPTEIEY